MRAPGDLGMHAGMIPRSRTAGTGCTLVARYLSQKGTRQPGAVIENNIWGKISPPGVRRVASAKGRRIRADLSGIWGGVSPSQPTRESGERRELASGILGGNAFWRILKATEHSFLHLYTDALSSSNSVSHHIWRQSRGFGTIVPPLPQRITVIVVRIVQFSLY